MSLPTPSRKSTLMIPSFFSISHLNETARQKLSDYEIRWHYSQQYFAELLGEAVLDDIITVARDPLIKKILIRQKQDEHQHAVLLKKITENIGLDERAGAFAREYTSFVKRNNSFPTKVFSFQVLVESVAHANIAWRLTLPEFQDFSDSDKKILSDEVRHINLAKYYARQFGRDEFMEELNPTVKREIESELLACLRSVNGKGLFKCASKDFGLSMTSRRPSDLDMLIRRTLKRNVSEFERQIAS